MSTRLERAERLSKQRKIHPTKHREIVITERNKEILALQAKVRLMSKVVRAAEAWYDWMTDDRSTVLEIWHSKEPNHQIPTLATTIENYRKTKLRKWK